MTASPEDRQPGPDQWGSQPYQPQQQYPPEQQQWGQWQQPYAPAPRRAPSFTAADAVGALGVAAVVALLGLPLAWLWARLAPPQLSIAQADGTFAPLPVESQHRFDDLAIFLMLGLAAGVLAGVGVWLLRQRRGPLALVGLAVGSLAAAWLASRVGVSLADARHDAAGIADGSLATVPARLESWWVVVAQPLAAVFTYGIAAAVNGTDDLGRRLS